MIKQQDLYQAFLTELQNLPAPSAQAVQLKISYPTTELVDWLSQQQLCPQLFWTRRNSDEQTAVVDSLKNWSSLSAAEDFLAHNASPFRIYGGWGFRAADYAVPWQNWPRAYFFLPRWELRQSTTESHLYLNLSQASENEVRLALQELSTAAPKPSRTHLDLPGSEQPAYPEWEELIQAAYREFASGTLQKIVLSRLHRVPQKGLSPQILKASAGATQAYRFWFSLTAQSHIFGVSPERLYARQGRQLYTEALAGTRPYPSNSREAEQLRTELLQSVKDKHEQEIVRAHLIQSLQTLSSNIHSSPLSVIPAGAVQHLYTHIQAELKQDVRDAQLAERLHPTPAVNGFPTALAHRRIQELEPHERGWYTGALGFCSREAAEWNVILRMGLIEQEQAHFFVGNGIVEGSDPREEWEELNAKYASLLALLGLAPSAVSL